MKRRLFLILLVLPVLFLSFFSCRNDDDFLENSSAKLEFSTDTLFFDTVFTTVGSVTLSFKVRNPYNKPVKLTSVRLGGLASSNFRINVDGISGVSFSDVEIGAKDSIFVFASVTVDPGNQNNPFFIEDSVIFSLNGNDQKVRLVAYGQDAYFYIPDHPATQYLPAYSLVSGTWANDKPHVVYGYAVVDEDSLLTIPAGTKVYMHNGAVLWVYKGGSLKINGSLGNEVVFTSDRLDDYYKDLPGMWGKIWLSAGSIDNQIDYAIIKNGSIGIHVDTLGNNNPALVVSNTIIDNMSAACLYAQGSKINATNCVFGNAGLYSVLLNIGGEYSFVHCTIGNYWNRSTRSTPALVLNNYYKDIYGNYQIRDLVNAYFGNCIIYGSSEEEYAFDKYSGGGLFNFTFENCMIKTSLSFGSGFVDCYKGTSLNAGFSDAPAGKFFLISSSYAIDKGKSSISGSIISDIAGNPRIGGTLPDLGAYEYTP